MYDWMYGCMDVRLLYLQARYKYLCMDDCMDVFVWMYVCMDDCMDVWTLDYSMMVLTLGFGMYVLINWDDGRHILGRVHPGVSSVFTIGRSGRTPLVVGRVNHDLVSTHMRRHLLDHIHRYCPIFDRKRGLSLRREAVEGREHGPVDPVWGNGRVDTGGGGRRWVIRHGDVDAVRGHTGTGRKR